MKTLTEVLTLERPMLGFDLETTGTNPDSARIVEVALEIMAPGKPTREYRTLVNPGVPIPPDATAIHGITDAMVADAPRFEALATNFLIGFKSCDFAGYNVRFDLRIVAAEFARAGKTWDYEEARILDSFRLWQVIEGRSLEHAVSRWLGAGVTTLAPQDEPVGERADGAHTALYDVRMATRVLAAQLHAYPDVPRDLQALHDLCWPGYYDSEGKLQWKNGQLCFSFGEHRGKALEAVPTGYLKWILGKKFSDKVKDVCRIALTGVYPTQHG